MPKPQTSLFLPAQWRKLPLSLAGAAAFRSLHDGPDTIDELLDRHLPKKQPTNEAEFAASERSFRVTSSRREALCLYRDVIRATRFFVWADAEGALWRDVLRSNARREFEEARLERDPEIITRLLIGGREAVQCALDKLAEAQRKKIGGGR